MPPTFLDDAIPTDGEKTKINEKILKERDSLSSCKNCNSCRVKATLYVSRARTNVSKFRRKFEKFNEYNYLGVFELFDKLRRFHKNELSMFKSPKLKKQASNVRMSGVLNEINLPSCNYRLLQFEVKTLFTDYKELFWNLIFRFKEDKKDYLFMLPYEVDMEEYSESVLDDENYSDSSDSKKATQKVKENGGQFTTGFDEMFSANEFVKKATTSKTKNINRHQQ